MTRGEVVACAVLAQMDQLDAAAREQDIDDMANAALNMADLILDLADDIESEQ